jgi:hypothetical protein
VAHLSCQDDIALDLFLEVEARVLVGSRFSGDVGLNRLRHVVEKETLMELVDRRSERMMVSSDGLI